MAAVAVVKHIKATGFEALEEISGWIHDAELIVDECRFEESCGRVILAFEQEPLDPALDLPPPEFVSQSWWATEYRMPYLRCCLRVNGVTAYVKGWEDLELSGLLLGVGWKADESTLVVHSDCPIRVPTSRLDVELEITDEIVSVRKRRVGRLISFDSTSRIASES